MLELTTKQLTKNSIYFEYAKAVSNSNIFDLNDFINMFNDKIEVINYLQSCSISDKIKRYLEQQKIQIENFNKIKGMN